jgi:signal transduction histidine kinase
MRTRVPDRLHLARRFRLPRRSVRLRLTVVYGGIFLVSGAALLAITYGLVAGRLPAAVTFRQAATGTGHQTVMAGGPGGPVQSAGPVAKPGQREFSHLVQSVVADQRATELRQLLTESGVALAGMAVISVGLGWLVAGRVLRPLRTMTTAARSISARNLDERLAIEGPGDELKELGDTFDGLLGRLEESFGAQRQFAANASHELRTPITRQRTMVEVALGDPDATVDSLRAVCGRVLAAGEEQERLIEALLTLARGQRGLAQREPVDLRTVTADALAAGHPEARQRGVRIDAALGAAPALGDCRLAGRLAANLVDNAVRHNVDDGWVTVVTRVHDGHAVLSVANSGPPIPPGEVTRLLQPFQRLGADRTTRDGLGLGLAIAHAITAAHGGTLDVRPRPAGGLEIEVSLPTATAAEGPVTDVPARAGYALAP